MVISESKKRVMISLTKEQDRKLTDGKTKGFSKSAVAALAIEEYAKKRNQNKKNKRNLAFLEGYEFSLHVF